MSEDRYGAPGSHRRPEPPTSRVATATPPAPAPSRVGYVPTHTNRVRDGLAVALLVLALLLPWSIEFGLGVPGSSGLVFVGVLAVTLLAVAAALAPHVGPLRLAAPTADVARTSRIRLWLAVPYLVAVLIFVAFHVVQTVRNGGTGAVPPGSGPGMWLGVAGALLAAQPSITSTTLEDNGFRRWYATARVLGWVSIVLAALSVAFNLYWRLRYLFVTDVDFGGRDAAVIVTTLLYGAVAMIALVIGSTWLVQKTAAAAIVAPTTLYAVFLVRPPTLAVYRGAALKCLTLIAFWSFAAAGLRVTDYLIALSLNLPHRIYDSVALTGFNVFTACIAVWLKRHLARGGLTSTVIAAFTAVLSVFTIAQLVIGVALAPRYADPTPRSADAIYGNDLAQQITSTFDVVICVLSLAIMLAALVTGPLAGYLVRRRETRAAAPAPATSGPQPVAPPTVIRPQQKTVPRIVRIKEDSTQLLGAANPSAPTTAVPLPTTEIPAATTALRIQRRPTTPSPDATQHIATPSEQASAERPTLPAKRPFGADGPPDA